MSTNLPDFDEAFALELAALAAEGRLVPVPVAGAPLGYGTDLSCVSDCTPDFAEVDPQSVQALAEALVRRLTTKRGTLPDDANCGLGVHLWLNHEIADVRGLQSYNDQVVGECAKDDRVVSSSCAVSFDLPTRRLGFQLHVVPAAPLSPFTLTFAVLPDGTALIESIV